jgi:hypothetical protein
MGADVGWTKAKQPASVPRADQFGAFGDPC